MAKQLNVSMALTADTSQAKAQLQDLQKQLTQLATTSTKGSSGLGVTKDLEKATKAAAELKVQLDKATNPKTGNLDFSKLNESLARSGKSLTDYGNQLRKLGPAGQQAFQNLASSVANSEVPLKRSNQLLTEFATTLKNTARWQISSSILHGFMGTLSSAYRYAQDLNESLNNIRIVTGQSVDQMAKFAEQANQSARALSTTTTAYTDAALIYYQQGLSDDIVKERTDVTIKMANVARENATEVSSYMTAIWNNFNKNGDQSAEHFADVMTKLGATTAASTKEIAGGLEKFASVADAIGLSFDYASSILATIVDKTRQSEDVVGTALKTIFARVQGLKLGETLDDGVGLNKYSSALEAVGVQVLDATGNLKDADIILSETAEKWETLSRAQQVALAQTVAGVRQYNQFVAMMDNWDSVEQNLNTARSADGTLQEQADIYAESWEAASKRVQAAAQAIYTDLLNDKFFITLLNGFEKLLSGVDNFIDGLGGLKGVLLTIGALATTVFQKQLSQGLTSMAYNLTMMTEAGRKAVNDQRTAFINDALKTPADKDAGMSASEKAREESMRNVLSLQRDMMANTDRMSEDELAVNKILIDRVKILGEQKVAAAQAQEAAQKKKSDAIDSGSVEAIKYATKNKQNPAKAQEEFLKKSSQYTKAVSAKVDLKPLLADLEKLKASGKATEQEFDALKAKIREVGKAGGLDESALDLQNCKSDAEGLAQALDHVKQELDQVEASADIDMQNMGISENTLYGLRDGAIGAAQAEQELTRTTEGVAGATTQASDSINNAHGTMENWATKTVKVAGAISSLFAAVSMLSGAIEKINDPDASGWEKFFTVMSTAAMIVPMVVTSLSSLLPAGGAAAAGATAAGAGGAVAGAGLTAGGVGAIFLKKALEALAGPIGWIIKLTIAIVALTALFIGLANARNADTIAAKKAKEAAEELAKAEEEAKSAADNLRNSIDKYKSAKETLDSCVKGTKEWKEALREVNDAAIDVLNNVRGIDADTLKGMYSREDGQITFNEGALDQLQNKADRLATEAAYASAAGSQRATQAQAFAKLGDTAGNLTIGKDSASESIVQTSLLAHLEELNDAVTLEDFKASLRKCGVEVDRFGDESIKKAQAQITEIASSVDAANEKFKLISAIKVDDALGDESDKYSDAAKEFASSQLYNETKQLEADWKQDLTGSKISRFSDSNNQVYKDTLEALQQAGYDLSAQTNNAVRGGDNDRSLAFLDSEGNEKVYNADQIASMIAAHKALENVAGDAQKAQEALEGLSGQGMEFADAMTKGFDEEENAFDLSDFTKDFTQTQLGEIVDGISEDGTVEDSVLQLLGMTAEQLDSLAGVYEKTGKDLGVALLEGAKNAADTLDETDKAKLENFNIDDMTVSEAQSAIKNRDAAEKNLQGDDKNPGLGEQGTDYLVDIEKSFTGNQKDLLEFEKGLGQISLTSEDATQNLIDLAEKYHISGDAVDQLIVQVDAIPKHFNVATSEISAELQELSKVTQNLKLGDTISPEDFNKLKDAGIDVDSFFNLMADGTYQLVGDAEAFKNMVENISIDKLKDQVLDYQTAAQRAADAHGVSQDSITNVSGSEIVSSSDSEQQLAAARAEYMSSFDEGSFDFSTLENGDKALSLLQDYKTNPEMEFTIEQLNLIQEMIGVVNEAEAEAQGQLLSTSSSLAELYNNLQQIGEVPYDEFASALINLGSQYENCSNEIAEYQAALAKGDKEQINAKQSALELSVRAGELGKKYGLTTDEVEQYAKELKESGKYTKANEKAFAEMAKDQLRYDKAVVSASKNMSKWKNDLKTAAKTGHLAADSAKEMADSYGDLLDIDGSQLSNDFLKSADNLNLMEKALNGDVDAYNQLQALARQEIAASIGLDDSQFQEGFNNLLSEYYQADSLDDIEVGAALDDANFLAALTEMVNAAGMTADQATDYLSSMGVDAQVEEETTTKPVKVMGYVANVNNQEAFDAAGKPIQVSSVTYTDAPYYGEGEETVTSLKVTSANKSSGGDIKHSGSNAANGGGSSGGGGGGGGGGEATKVNNSKKNKVDEVERYANITSQLSKIQTGLDRIASAKDRAFGSAKYKLLQKEISAYDDLIAAQQEYINQIKEANEADAEALKNGSFEYTDSITGEFKTANAGAKNYLGMDLIFDTATGALINIEELQAANVDAYNAVITKYQGMEETDEIKSAIQLAEEQFEEFNRLLEAYRESTQLLDAETDTLIDQQRQKFDAMLEGVVLSVQLKIDVEEDSLKLLNFLMGQLKDDAYDAAESINYLAESVGHYSNQIDAAKDGIQQIFGNHGMTFDPNNIPSTDELLGANFTEEEISQIREWADTVVSTLEEITDARQEMFDKLNESYDAWISKIDNEIDKIDAYSSMIENYQNIIDVVGRKALKIDSDIMKSLNRASLSVAQNNLTAQQDKLSALIADRDRVQEEYEHALAQGWTEEARLWKEHLDQINNDILDTEQNVKEGLLTTLEIAQQGFEDSVKYALESFSELVAGAAKSVAELRDSFDHQKELNELYLQDYQKIYNLSKLTRDINKSISDSTTIKSKQLLAELQSEIVAKQAEGVEMSQYEVDELRAQYELRLALIQLEEAQDAKSTVRMSRDAEGNYGYVYTADADKVGEAQQNYEDKLFALQELNSQHIQEMQEGYLACVEEMQEAISNLDRTQFETDEDYNAKIEEIRDFYVGKARFYTEQLGIAIDNNKDLYNQDWTAYSKLTGYKISADQKFISSFDETTLGMLTDFNTIEDMFEAFVDAIGAPGEEDTLLNTLDEAYKTWRENVDESMKLAGTSMDEFRDTVDEDVNGEGGIVANSQVAAQSVEEMSETMGTELEEAEDAIRAFEDEWSDRIYAMIDENSDWIDSIYEVIAALAALDIAQGKTPPNTDVTPQQVEHTEKPTPAPPPDETNNKGTSYQSGLVTFSGNGASRVWTDSAGNSYKYGSAEASALQTAFNKAYSKNGGYKGDYWGGWTKTGGTLDASILHDKYGLRTGGYTGDWGGDDGRLAFLHKKELVLNAEDTENMLAAIDIVRQLAKAIDLSASWASTSAISASGVGNIDNTLQQQVSIQAEFPNATDHNEIELAIEGLINSASQYANRK